MAITDRKEYIDDLEKQQLEVRNMVFSGLEQIKESRIRNLNEVCDRLEKKYRNVQYTMEYN